MSYQKMTAAAVLALVSASSFAQVKLATPFGSGMVLQREKAVPVWGTADAGEKVSVAFGGQSVTTTADAKGQWRVALKEMAASKESRELVVSGDKTPNPIRLADVLVGEVWFVSGQSNTEMPLVGVNPHFSDRQGRLVAQMTHKPYIRYAYASNYKWTLQPRTEATYPVTWKKFTPENLCTRQSFSAMGVYYALELYSALDIPIGLVGSYWGGTRSEPWTPKEGFEAVPGLEKIATQKLITDAEKKANTNLYGKVQLHQQPTVLWNEMVAPWCPMAMRGFIWYQGCSNSGDGRDYRLKMHALYRGWSKKFENPDLKLYFVQLAPFNHTWWNVQLGQAEFAKEEKNAAMVTTGDIGNGADIHPWEKGTIGKRLAALAMKYDYGFNLVAEAPTVKSVTAKDGQLILSFNDATGWYVYDPSWQLCECFEVAGRDGVWKKARVVNANDDAKKAITWKTNGIMKGANIIVASDEVKEPVKVRYLYNKPWVSTVFATTGLPLGPFEAEVK